MNGVFSVAVSPTPVTDIGASVTTAVTVPATVWPASSDTRTSTVYAPGRWYMCPPNTVPVATVPWLVVPSPQSMTAV